MSDPIIGSSLTSSGVVAKKTFTEELVLGVDSVNDISHEYADAGVHSVPSSKALNDGLSYLDEEVKKIDPNNNFFKDNTVITLPLIDMTFDDNSDWQILNWQTHDGAVSFTGNTYVLENFVGIPSEVIPFQGHYFILADIPRLDSGKIVLYNDNGDILKTFTEYGKFSVEVYVDNADIATFKFVAEGVFPGEVVTINSVLFSRITPRLREYMNYLFAGGSGELTYDQVVQLINQSLTNTLHNFDTRLIPIEDDLHDHLLNTSNPHNVTKEQIGAASSSHTHTLLSLGGAAAVHTHEPEECGAAPLSHTHTPSQCSAAPEFHTHTADECGAAEVEHTHTPIECGAASIDHTHTPVSIGAANIVHEHTEYITEANVTQIVNAAVTGATIDSIKMLLPLVITTIPTGILPLGYEDANFSVPVYHVKFPYIIHEANSDYDPYDGVAVTNVDTLIGNPIQYAFKKHLTTEDHTANVAAFYASAQVLPKKVLIEYRFHQPRTIDKFTFFKDLTNVIGGVPTIVDLYVDGNFVIQVVGETTTPSYSPWVDNGDSLETVLPSVVTGKTFSFVVSKVYRDVSAHWGTRIEFGFADSVLNTLDFTYPIVINPIGSNGTQSRTVGTISPLALNSNPEPNTELYVNLKATPQDDIILTSFETSYFPMEFGDIEKGINLFTDKFSGKIHPYFGTLTVTNEEVLNPCEAVYSDDLSYWKTTDGTLDSLLTHTFLNSYEFIGYKLIFVEDLAPDKWSIAVVYEDDTTEIVHDVQNFMTPQSPNSAQQVKFVSTSLSLPQKIKSVSLRIQGTQGQTALGVHQFIPLFRSNFYAIYKNEITSSDLFPFGRLRVVESYDHTWKGYKHEGLTLGNYCHIPLQGMAMQPDEMIVHRISNPFNTKMLDFSIFTYPDATALSPHAFVTSVNEEIITITTGSAGRYSIGIKRLW